MFSKKWRGKTWKAAEVDPAVREAIARELSCSSILAGLLVRRGVTGSEEAAQFLQPKLSQLPDPDLLPGIEAAAQRICRAIQENEPIAVFGDYDVDGVSSTALLLEFFDFLKRPVRHYIPHREEEGYGMNEPAVERLAQEGVRLIITVDNGSAAFSSVERARALGVDVVITDHHLPADPLPRPAAFVNPWLPGSRYPFKPLAGAGVAFKLIWALCRQFSRSRKISPEFRDFMMDSLGLVALGTIADVVPLLGENRVLACYGLKALAATRRPGLQCLVRFALQGEERRRDLEARDVAFRIGPCLNAAGRLGGSEAALQLLVSRDAASAAGLMAHLIRENDRRRQIEQDIYQEARDCLLKEVDLAGDRVVVLAKEGWHPGVIGIVAARLVEEFYRPTLLIALEGDQGKGSARSIPQVSICNALERARGCLEGFGGHDRAAGVRINTSRVGELRRLLNEAVEVQPQEMVPELVVDGECDLSEWTPALLRELERLAPHGEGNPEPLFALRRGEVVGEPRLLGRDGAHLSFFVRQKGVSLRAVAFRMAEYLPRLHPAGVQVALAYQPKLNCWGDDEKVELVIREVEVLQPPLLP
ncbi:MAG: single-stranded-DNA-specific exonuclease RecJ [Planctomycetes bacterium]|nr:single-stranded-DNA-specific exonuclease RecJ [Planctomycetota bacterium]